LQRTFQIENNKVIPTFLNWDQEKGFGTVNSRADRDSVGLKLNELFIVEFYSRKV
jgi:hypothetical protein